MNKATARQILVDFLNENSASNPYTGRGGAIAIAAIIVLRDDLLAWAREWQLDHR
jgi:hypothetical protein